MESTAGKRMLQWREFKGISITDLSRATGINVTTISQAESPKGKASNPSYDTLTKMLTAFPDLNPDWLLLGSGPMLRDGRTLTPMPPHFEEARPVALSINQPTREEYQQLQEENRKLREELAKKEGTLTAVEGEVTWLRKQVGGKTEASADAATEDTTPAPQMIAERNHEYVAPAPEAAPRVAVGFRFGV